MELLGAQADSRARQGTWRHLQHLTVPGGKEVFKRIKDRVASKDPRGQPKRAEWPKLEQFEQQNK